MPTTVTAPAPSLAAERARHVLAGAAADRRR